MLNSISNDNLAKKARPLTVSLIVFIISISLTLGLWSLLRKNESDQFQSKLREKTQLVRNDVQKFVQSHIYALQRMALRWEANSGTTQKKWRSDASNYVETLSGLRAVEWVDKSYHIRWIEPLLDNEKALGLNIMFNEERKKILTGASTRKKITLTPPFNLVQGYKAFIAYIPIYVDNQFDGFIVGIFDIRQLMDHFINTMFTENINIDVFINRELAYQFGSAQQTNETSIIFEEEFKLYDVIWHLNVYPDPRYLSNELTRIPYIALSLGIIVSLLLTAASYLLITAKRATELYKSSQIKLIDAKNDAEQATVVKGEFLARMSHEIRTPMNGIIGMLELVLTTPLSDEQKHRIKMAYSSANSLLGLINSILDFSKIEAGKLDLEQIDFDLRRLLDDLVEIMSEQIKSEKLELILDTTEIHQTVVKGDPGRLRQVLTNLIGNAIKFTHEGEILIYASTEEISNNQLKMICSITDTGIGIANNKFHNLFNSFSQLDSSTTRKYGGTGLGLSISKQLCELMGGDISVTSTQGKGSCFKFNIVLQKSPQSKTVMPSIDIKSLSLLVVDQDKTSCNALKHQLNDWGMHVVTAQSAEQALLLCEQAFTEKSSIFDIAIIDMQLDDLDGEELAKKIKAHPHFKQMKLIMMTSVAAHGDARRITDAGFSAYFPKPVSTSDLYDSLAVVSQSDDKQRQDTPLVTRHYLQELKVKQGKQSEKINWPANTRLLLVEDNHVNQLVATGLIKNIGLDIDIANNGVEALQKIKNLPDDIAYSCILMDCQMPEMDGYETSRQIRSGSAGEKNTNIPIIAMTANAMKGDREKCLAAGMNDYLSKPVEPAELEKKLLHWLINK